MKTLDLKTRRAFIVGSILTLPAIYFIFISVMKYIFHQPYLFDAATPFLEIMGIKESIGLNINLLILFGPVLAFLLNILSVLDIHFQIGRDNLNCQLSIRKSWWNLFVVFCSAATLLVLFTYLLGENCTCS